MLATLAPHPYRDDEGHPGKAYQGAGYRVHVPFRGRHGKQRKRRHNRSRAKIRFLVEQATAVLKS